ncbi:uncharacterized protein THITE_2057010, partial [Thermothielavioides terrestris NRRL 8126]
LMFDDSFHLSRTYFAALQTLRRASNMVDDTIRNWSDLRRRWNSLVCPSGMFSDDDLADAAHNWDTATAIIEARAQRVQATISRKSEEIKSLRDGLFNATSLREAGKSIALNRAIYVFTVVTVLYTPIGFLAVRLPAESHTAPCHKLSTKTRPAGLLGIALLLQLCRRWK